MPQIYGMDRYGRRRTGVLLFDGINVNHMLVNDGWCWWYRKYAPGDTVLEGLEKDVREGPKGLSANRYPVPPWVIRKAKWR
jgi:endonuclease YncB( thermonuclease family)